MNNPSKIIPLCAPRKLSVIDSRAYSIQTYCVSRKAWLGVSYIIGTANADRRIAELIRAGQRVRAMPAKPSQIVDALEAVSPSPLNLIFAP